MAASQALYGVTMQVKGVSRFVSVELDEVDEFVPDTIGTAKRTQEGAGGAGDAALPGDAPGSPAEGRDMDTGEPIKEIPRQPLQQDEGALASVSEPEGAPAG